jgi:transcriptional regulator with XRE-family HTH domain
MTGWGVHEDRAVVGRRIRQARRELGLTQAELATRIGVSLGVFDRFETGKGDPSDKLEQIAEITDKPLSWYTSTDQYDGGDGISEIGLPAELRRRLTESRGQRLPADAETIEEGEAGHLAKPSPLPTEDSSARTETEPGEAGSSQDRLEERGAHASQQEPNTALAVEDEDAAADEMREELERVNTSQQQLAATLEQSRSELATSRGQEALLAQRTSELEAELRAAEEHAAKTTARLDQAETELERLQNEERARAEELARRDEELAVLSGELDTREAAVTNATRDVSFRSIQLDTREAGLRFRSAQLDTREAELKYRSARLDTREATVANAESDLDRRRRALELESTAAVVATGPPPREDEHLAVMPDQGYKLVSRPGAVPRSGVTVDLDRVRYRVLRVQRSPFPGDDRQCAVLELVRPDDEHSRSHAAE